MIGWGIISSAMMLVETPTTFYVLRFLLGAGEAGNWPAAVKLMAEWFPANERSTASGIFNSGSALGSVIAPPLPLRRAKRSSSSATKRRRKICAA